MKRKTYNQIKKSVSNARKKHPDFAKNINEAITILTSEIGEICTAILKETEERVIEEAFDSIAVLIRIVEKEYEKSKY